MKVKEFERVLDLACGESQPIGRLKVIVIVGYQNTGKTTLVQRLFKRLCYRFVGHGPMGKNDKGEDVYSLYWGDCHGSSGKIARGFFGEDGDDEDCVYENLYEVAKANYVTESDRFDFAIIPLRRIDHDNQSRSWLHWIPNVVARVRTGKDKNGNMVVPPIPNAFLDAEFYYVHTAWPQYFRDMKPVMGEVAQSSTVTVPTVDELACLVENHVISLLGLFLD